MELNLLTWTLALLPVLVVLILMLGFKWGGSRAGAAGWIAAVLIAWLFFAAGPRLIAYTQAKAVLLSLDVLYIIWTALLLYHTADEAGAVRMIGISLPRLTADRTMQGLLIGWLFASFLQGMGGFGVPVAVAAPLLVGLGFNPVQAVVMACIGHGWAVNYGSLATSFQTLMAVTGLPGELLAPDSAWLLGLSAYVCGAIVALVAGGWRGLLRSLPAVLVLGSVMAFSQYALAVNRLWNLGATGSAMLGLLVGVGVCRLPLYRGNPQTAPAANFSHLNGGDGKPRSLKLSLSAYAILVVLTFAINLIPPLNAFLDQIQLNLTFPELRTGFGWVTPAGPGRSISLFGHTGSILLYASLISYFIYRRAGYYRPAAAARIGEKTVKGAVNSSLGILAMVGMAVVMSHAGMTNLLALGMSRSFGAAAYPLIAPFIGALGAFITGSNNNSNVLFAVLQMRTAELLRLSVPLILGAQTAGGSLGSIMAPAKVIVGCSTVGLSDREGEVMAAVIRYGLIPIGIVALAAWLAA
ncbi:L-lactate permease [Bellilinea sp.]|uniref:L-lactate permease n=1 Tax=Bellilinea sp. TaxID=2838785 RepID=UPI002ADE48A1|nr:L-lactate permease [Bellilinea sp.]